MNSGINTGIGIGGKSAEEALASLSSMTDGLAPIGKDEHAQRIAKAQGTMRQQGIAAIYLNAGANLTYFTGTKWYASERMVGAILPAEGALEYIAPAFEESTLQGFMLIEGRVNCWEEHESPYQLFVDVLARIGIVQNAAQAPRIGIDESAALLPTASSRWQRAIRWKMRAASRRIAAAANPARKSR